MTRCLPTHTDLERLPLRAIVAYAARSTRRVSAELRGSIADSVLDDALLQLDVAWKATRMTDVNVARILSASERVVEGFRARANDIEPMVKHRLVFCFIHAALAAMHTILAADDTTIAYKCRQHAAASSEKAVKPIEKMDGDNARALLTAARHDYDCLLQECGECEDIVVGEPIRCFGVE